MLISRSIGSGRSMYRVSTSLRAGLRPSILQKFQRGLAGYALRYPCCHYSDSSSGVVGSDPLLYHNTNSCCLAGDDFVWAPNCRESRSGYRQVWYAGVGHLLGRTSIISYRLNRVVAVWACGFYQQLSQPRACCPVLVQQKRRVMHARQEAGLIILCQKM